MNDVMLRRNACDGVPIRAPQLRRNGVPMQSFSEFVESERSRITAEMERLRLERSKIGDAMFALERELGAIAAYEAAKSGKPAKSATGARATRRGSKREELVVLIRNNPGLARRDILAKLGATDDKSAMSVSNAITGLIKSNRITREGGRYRIAA